MKTYYYKISDKTLVDFDPGFGPRERSVSRFKSATSIDEDIAKVEVIDEYYGYSKIYYYRNERLKESEGYVVAGVDGSKYLIPKIDLETGRSNPEYDEVISATLEDFKGSFSKTEEVAAVTPSGSKQKSIEDFDYEEIETTSIAVSSDDFIFNIKNKKRLVSILGIRLLAIVGYVKKNNAIFIKTNNEELIFTFPEDTGLSGIVYTSDDNDIPVYKKSEMVNLDYKSFSLARNVSYNNESVDIAKIVFFRENLFEESEVYFIRRAE
jgi:hypothetical protein